MLQISNRDMSKSEESNLSAFLKPKSNHEISIEGTTQSYCVGMVNISNSVVSTSTNLGNGQMLEFCNIFLNVMSKIVKAHNASIIKNLEGGLLYYFPMTIDGINMRSFVDVLECGLSLIESRHTINQIITSYHLPTFNCRVNTDYGIVSVTSSRSQPEDIISSAVNLCSKMNGAAKINSLIIGRDLYQFVRSFKHYEFRAIEKCMLGLKMNYPAYAVSHKESKIF